MSKWILVWVFTALVPLWDESVLAHGAVGGGRRSGFAVPTFIRGCPWPGTGAASAVCELGARPRPHRAAPHHGREARTHGHKTGSGVGAESAGGAVGAPGTRPGYAVVQSLLLPAQLPRIDRDEARLEERARRLGLPARPASMEVSRQCESLSAAVALTTCFPDLFPSMSSARKRIRRGEVLSQAREELATTSSLSGGDLVLLQERAAPGLYPHAKSKLASEISVLFEDEFMAAVVKPPGVLVHKGSRKGSTHGNTIVSALAHVLAPTAQTDALERPVALHRLDQGTGGVLLAAKTRSAAQELSRQFEERTVTKEYETIVCGLLQGKGRIEHPLGGKRAVTEWDAVESAKSLKYGHVTLVRAVPETGRTHQIRRHMVSVSHPIGWSA
jgi:23S rRNA pseudouridine1911/1915/1917 synthase